jgi:hypothetical protein
VITIQLTMSWPEFHRVARIGFRNDPILN